MHVKGGAKEEQNVDYYMKNLGCGINSEVVEAKEGLISGLNLHEYMRSDGMRY